MVIGEGGHGTGEGGWRGKMGALHDMGLVVGTGFMLSVCLLQITLLSITDAFYHRYLQSTLCSVALESTMLNSMRGQSWKLGEIR